MVEPQWKIDVQYGIVDLYEWKIVGWYWVKSFDSYEDALEYIKKENKSSVVYYYNGDSNLLRGFDGPRS